MGFMGLKHCQGCHLLCWFLSGSDGSFCHYATQVMSCKSNVSSGARDFNNSCSWRHVLNCILISFHLLPAFQILLGKVLQGKKGRKMHRVKMRLRGKWISIIGLLDHR